MEFQFALMEFFQLAYLRIELLVKGPLNFITSNLSDLVVLVEGDSYHLLCDGPPYTDDALHLNQVVLDGGLTEEVSRVRHDVDVRTWRTQCRLRESK